MYLALDYAVDILLRVFKMLGTVLFYDNCSHSAHQPSQSGPMEIKEKISVSNDNLLLTNEQCN